VKSEKNKQQRREIKLATKKVRKNSKGGTKRKADKFAGLNPRMHPMARREYLDGDYYDKLNDKEKAFMSKFIDEYYGGSLANKEDKAGRRKDLHKSDKRRKECYDRNNARNRDMYILATTKGKMDKLMTDEKYDSQVETPCSDASKHEDTINELIDIKDSLKRE
jgi:hypothetical protein